MSEQNVIFVRSGLAALLVLSLSSLAAAQVAPAGTDRKAAASGAKTADPDPDVALARKAALAWLDLVDGARFEATWDEAATSFQKAQKKDEWSKGLGGARPTMGKMISRKFLNSEVRTSLPDLPPDKYITIRFTTVFEKHQDGAESVTLVKDGARGFRTMSYFLK